MSIGMSLVFIGIILILLDIFFLTDLPTVIAIILFSLAFYNTLNYLALFMIVLIKQMQLLVKD